MGIKADILAKTAAASITAKKHGPTIAFIAGLGLSLWATVEAVRSTLRAEDEILEPAKAEFKAIDISVNKDKKPNEYRSARQQVYIKSIRRGLKLYGKPLLIWSFAMVCLVGGYKTQADRCATAINAATAAATALSNMHENTKQAFGDEVAMALRTGEDIPGAVERCDFDKVKDGAKKKIKYSSNPGREYKDLEVDDKTSYRGLDYCSDPCILIYDEHHIKPGYWYKNPVDRLMFLQATEDHFNRQLESGAVKSVCVKDIRNAVGYLDKDETINDVILGWWENDDDLHPIDFGLGYLHELLEGMKFDRAGDIVYNMEHVMLGDGHDCKREWKLILNVMGDIYNH